MDRFRAVWLDYTKYGEPQFVLTIVQEIAQHAFNSLVKNRTVFWIFGLWITGWNSIVIEIKLRARSSWCGSLCAEGDLVHHLIYFVNFSDTKKIKSVMRICRTKFGIATQILSLNNSRARAVLFRYLHVKKSTKNAIDSFRFAQHSAIVRWNPANFLNCSTCIYVYM